MIPIVMFALAASVVTGPVSETSFLAPTSSGTREYIITSLPTRDGCSVSVRRVFAGGGDHDQADDTADQRVGGKPRELRQGGDPGEPGNLVASIRCVRGGKIIVTRFADSAQPEKRGARATDGDDEEE